MTLGAGQTAPPLPPPPRDGYGSGNGSVGGGAVDSFSLPAPIDLKHLHGCLSELEVCSQALAYMDHLWGIVIDDLARLEPIMEAINVRAAKAAREDAGSSATATEIKAGMFGYINERSEDRKVADELRGANDRNAKLERYFRSIEKRIGAAQSASNVHERLTRGGG